MKRIIREEQVNVAACNNGVIHIDRDTIITPQARDRAKELGVTFAAAETEGDEITLSSGDRFEEVFPVKRVGIACDHGGFYLKETVKKFLRDQGYVVHDYGPQSPQPCDYPDYAFQVARAVAEGKMDRGIMIDSVGIGSAMAANKTQGILAAKCNDATEARSAREHNFANVLTLGAKIIGESTALDIVRTFLETKGGAIRHQRRVQKIMQAECRKR